MTLDSDQLRNVNVLKDATIEMVKNKFIPNAAARRLKEILTDDNIDAEKFVNELRKVVKSSEKLNWDRISSKLYAQVSQFSILQIGVFFLGLFLLFIFRKTIFSKKTKKKLLPIISGLGLRLVSLGGYYFCIAGLVNTFLQPLSQEYPVLAAMVPLFVIKGTYIYSLAPNILSFVYLTLVIRCLREKFPRPRIVRFHIVQGFLFYIFQNLPDQIIQLITRGAINDDTQFALLSLIFIINLYWVIPGLFQALTLSYPKNSFLREAVELNLGRDEFGPDGSPFKWWDRDK